ncbi:precorrin-2/cobalt-factor-2 C20-methyltransferase [[Clostridium] aminophilum]|uniref:Precorrin-2/cobalt-factor-2 C20-methyltransferase n=1 Tax=[Clostridium] aminophilum TaxID=1526 RepID=A0A1I0BJ20_9FIRM|nr:precorrin-2 C(20)-methyltransferase [[Clostridium] aminophilum]SET06237.1 precorrin-2/cobalt-factor-2 C20-methyltransferase [[Clostridium] aminophilum]
MTGKRGVLYGVSVGPGDPELMTLRAVRTLEACDVIAAPEIKGGSHAALDIARRAVCLERKEIRMLSFTMSRDPEILVKSHEKQAEILIGILEQGKNVAMLNLGDASLYGTWEYIRDIAEHRGFETKTIPGVTSFSASAAALNVSLTSGADPLIILPASHPDITQKYLKLPGAKVLMKSGRNLAAIREMIEEAGLTDRAQMAVNCGMPDEKLFHSLRDAGDEEGYFSTILVK